MTPQARSRPMSRAEALARAEKAQRQADVYAETDPFRAELWQNIANSFRLIAQVAEERGDGPAGEGESSPNRHE